MGLLGDQICDMAMGLQGHLNKPCQRRQGQGTVGGEHRTQGIQLAGVEVDVHGNLDMPSGGGEGELFGGGVSSPAYASPRYSERRSITFT